jgi:hypothetical protein
MRKKVGKWTGEIGTPNLAANGYHLFLHCTKYLASQNLRSGQQIKVIVQDWMKASAVNFFNKVKQKPVPWYNCLNLFGKYVQNQFNVGTYMLQ